MSQKLPGGGLEWAYEMRVEDIYDYKDSSDLGYILEVDAHIPEKLHDYLNDFLFSRKQSTFRKIWVPLIYRY